MSRALGDDDLHDLIDAGTPEAVRLALEQRVAASPEHAARVARWQRDSEALRSALEPLADEPLPASFAAPPDPVPLLWLAAGLGFAAGLAAGGIAVWLLLH